MVNWMGFRMVPRACLVSYLCRLCVRAHDLVQYHSFMSQQHAFVLVLAFAMAAGLPAAEKRVVAPPGTQPNRPFSPGLKVDDTLYVSGMTGRTPDGKIPENFEDEVKQTLDNIGEVLKAGGMSFAD